MGLLRRREEGRRVVYERAREKEWPALEVIVRSFAPLAILRNVLSNVTGVEAAFVFGSYAAGTARDDSAFRGGCAWRSLFEREVRRFTG